MYFLWLTEILDILHGVLVSTREDGLDSGKNHALTTTKYGHRLSLMISLQGQFYSSHAVT